MTTERRIGEICEFLRTHVCGDIELKKPNDDAANEVVWVNPSVCGVYVPRAPGEDGWLSPTPCVIVAPIRDTRQRDGGVLTIRLLAMTWDPGTREERGAGNVTDMALEIDREGWRGLYAFMERIQAALAARATIGDMEIGYPMEASLFGDGEAVPDLRPYYLGMIDLPMRYASVPRRNQIRRDLME